MFCAPSFWALGLCSVFLLIGGLSLPLSSAVAGTVYNVGRVFYAKGYYTGNPHKGLWGCTFFRLATGGEGAYPVLHPCAVRVWQCVLCVAAERWTWGRCTDTSECARIHQVCLATVNALAVFLRLNGFAFLSTGTQCTGYFISSGPLSSLPTRPSRREGAAVASAIRLTTSLAAAGVCPTRRTLCAALDVICHRNPFVTSNAGRSAALFFLSLFRQALHTGTPMTVVFPSSQVVHPHALALFNECLSLRSTFAEVLQYVHDGTLVPGGLPAAVRSSRHGCLPACVH